MKKLILIIGFAIVNISCNGQKIKPLETVANFNSYGVKISEHKADSKEEMTKKYNSLKVGDTLNVKFKSKINAVCQNKGCWMKVDLADNKETFVKFKNYAFFMPKDSKDDEVILNGKAFVSMESVEDQKHYAGDAGKSKAEIDAILTPKKTLSFTADGVLIHKK